MNFLVLAGFEPPDRQARILIVQSLMLIRLSTLGYRVMVWSCAIVKPVESLLLVLTLNILPSTAHTACLTLFVAVCDEMFRWAPGRLDILTELLKEENSRIIKTCRLSLQTLAN